MPTPRQYANPAARQAAYRQRQAARAPQVGSVPVLPATPSPRRWQALCRHAAQLLHTVETEMQDYSAARSERWQESARGEAHSERLEAVQEALSVLEELR